MSDLISRQAVIDIIHKEIENTESFAEHDALINLEIAVSELQTEYDVDKVVEEIDKFRHSKSYGLIDTGTVIKIVKAGGVHEHDK